MQDKRKTKAQLMKEMAQLRRRMAELEVDAARRQEADTALRESEERLRLAVNAAKLGIWDWDVRTNRATWSGHSIYDTPPVLYEDFLARVHADDRNAIRQAADRAIDKGALYDVEYRIMNPDGSLRWHTARGRTYYDEAGNPLRMLGVTRDITDQKMAEAALRETEARLHTAVNYMPFAFWIRDADNRYAIQNLHSKQQWGDLIGTRGEKSGIDPAMLAEWEAVNRRAMAGEVLRTEVERTVGGERRIYSKIVAPICMDDQIRGTVGMLIDMTERIQAEHALRKNQEFLTRAQEVARIGSFSWDLVTNTVEWSDGMYSVLGIDRANFQVTVEAVRERIHPEDRDLFTCTIDQIMESGQPKALECRALRGDGATIVVYVDGVVDQDSAGKPIRLLGTLQDITARKRVEQERTRLYEQVQAANERLQALSRQLISAEETERRRIASELHDEIGQALTVAKLDLQAVRSANDNLESAAQLDESIDLVGRTLQQVRDLSLDLRPSVLDDLGLAAALRWFVDRLAQRAGVDARFTTDTPERRLPPEIETTCFRIAQEALTNVIRHACAQRVDVRLRTREADVELTIRDDGRGFDVSAARRLAMRGASLGLLGMEERVALHGGCIQIESAPGQGTLIRAHFTRAEERCA